MKSKKILSVLVTAALFLALLSIGISADGTTAPAPLKFNDDGSFKIIHVPDLQEVFTTSPITKDFLWDIAETEQPDLFILGGDNFKDAFILPIDGFAEKQVRRSIDSFMSVFQAIYEEYGIPVTMVLGNHDAEKSGIDRKAQFEIYDEYECFIGVAEHADEADKDTKGEKNAHYGTHVLQINASDSDSAVFNLWMFDSGDYAPEGAAKSGYDNVQAQQVKWFEDTHAALGGLPSLAFQHIIVEEVYNYLAKDAKGNWTLPEKYKGVMGEDPCPGYNNAGQLTALDNAGCLAVFSGHDHTNTFEIPRQDETGKDLTTIINSPTAGFGSYGKAATRGVRVITLDESDLQTFTTDLLTYKDTYSSGLEAMRMYLYVCTPFLPMLGALLDYVIYHPLRWIAGLFD